MPLAFTCEKCGAAFTRKQMPAHRPRFCSRACLGKARSAGEVVAKRKTGSLKVCEVCKTPFWVKLSHSKRRRFCREECRQEAFRQGFGRRDLNDPRPYMLRGETIACRFCGDTVYRKKSMLSRNISITCGKRECVSAYGRSMWGLAPKETVTPRSKRQRVGNFSASQRVAWLGVICAKCGASENLALDHIIPVCVGGLSVLDNAQTLCQPCNNWKAKHVDMPLARKQALSGGS